MTPIPALPLAPSAGAGSAFPVMWEDPADTERTWTWDPTGYPYPDTVGETGKRVGVRFTGSTVISGGG
jgi:hypothetical protein